MPGFLHSFFDETDRANPADRFLAEYRAAQKTGGPASETFSVESFTALFARLGELPVAKRP